MVLDSFKDPSTILVGDFNARHRNFGDSITSPSGQKFMNWLIDSNMMTLNNKKPTHICRGQEGGILDLCMANVNIAYKLSFQRLDDTGQSDHFPVYLNFNHSFKKRPGKIKSYTNWRDVKWWADSEKIFPSNIYGFRKGICVTDCLRDIYDSVWSARNKTLENYLICLDIKGAYDNVQHEILIERLEKMGMNTTLVRWIYNFITNRTISVKWRSILSTDKLMSKGLPQGAILSPFLYNCFMLDLCKLNDRSTKLFIYADDIYVHVTVRKDNRYSCLQDTLKKIISWSAENKHKILGVIFEHNLSWRAHEAYLVKRLNNTLNLIKILSHPTQGMRTKNLLKIIQQIMIPQLIYGCEIRWGEYISSQNKYDIYINKAIRKALGVSHLAPNDGADYFFPATRGGRFKKERKDLRADLDSYESKWILDKNVVRQKKRIPPWINFRKLCNIDLKNLHDFVTDYAPFIKNLTADVKAENVWGSDGSKNLDGTGFGITNLKNTVNRAIKIVRNASIYTAEVSAIWYILKYLANLSEATIIFTDSLAAVEAIASFEDSNNNIIENIRYEIYKNMPNSKIIICWIPGHKGIEINERADFLAKQAVNSRNTPILPIYTWQDIKKEIREDREREIETTWQNTKYYCYFKNVLNAKQLNINWPDSRKMECKINKILTRSILTNYPKFKLKLSSTPLCINCKVRDDFEHRLNECKKYIHQRNYIAKFCDKENIQYIKTQ
ncbi:uncharacterized protein LOC118201067 [Stegodyphus dumicola]|uniref:uncharacterized protein LOC118201067 n=1 Tax=Stegodyphus dumicola TaxID=202533 RepID=UPI0015AD2686|nr:uncharacterized protein LOC118201067 [Stegodyphus dumicola]